MRWTSLLAVVMMFTASQTVHANFLDRILNELSPIATTSTESGEVIVHEGSPSQFAGYRYGMNGFGMNRGFYSGFHGYSGFLGGYGHGGCGCGHHRARMSCGCGHKMFTRHSCCKPKKTWNLFSCCKSKCKTDCCDAAPSCEPSCGCGHRHHRVRRHRCGCGCDSGSGTWSDQVPAEAAPGDLGDPPIPPMEARNPRPWRLPRTTGLLPTSVE